MITVEGTIDGGFVLDTFGLAGESPVEEWTDGADPLALVLAAVLDTPGVPPVTVLAIGHSVLAVLRAYARGDVSVDW